MDTVGQEQVEVQMVGEDGKPLEPPDTARQTSKVKRNRSRFRFSVRQSQKAEEEAQERGEAKSYVTYHEPERPLKSYTEEERQQIYKDHFLKYDEDHKARVTRRDLVRGLEHQPSFADLFGRAIDQLVKTVDVLDHEKDEGVNGEEFAFICEEVFSRHLHRIAGHEHAEGEVHVRDSHLEALDRGMATSDQNDLVLKALVDEESRVELFKKYFGEFDINENGRVDAVELVRGIAHHDLVFKKLFGDGLPFLVETLEDLDRGHRAGVNEHEFVFLCEGAFQKSEVWRKEAELSEEVATEDITAAEVPK